MAKEKHKASESKPADPWTASIRSDVIRKAAKLARQCRITHGANFRLKDHDPADTMGFKSEDHPRAKQALQSGIRTLADQQEMLSAQDQWAVLLIFQGIDAAGKDGIISHVMSGVNPAGCQIYSFKEPSSEDLDHDSCGGVSDPCRTADKSASSTAATTRRSSSSASIPNCSIRKRSRPPLITRHIWKERYKDIHNFERYLHRNGIATAKFFLNLSKEEQKRRFLERADNPDKNWKFSATDVAEREHWDDYQQAFEEMIRNTSAKESPWYVIPADHKWFARILVVAAVIETLDRLKLSYPKVDKTKLAEIKKAKKVLLSEL